jgi:5'-3' exonuclease
VKAWAGCKSDEVPGITGVGEKTAIKYLLGQLKVTSTKYPKFRTQEAKEMFARNIKLVKLPFERCPELTIVPDKLSFEGFLEVCKQYDFNHMLKKEELTKWKKFVFKDIHKGLF